MANDIGFAVDNKKAYDVRKNYLGMFETIETETTILDTQWVRYIPQEPLGKSAFNKTRLRLGPPGRSALRAD